MCGRYSLWDLTQLEKTYGPWKPNDSQLPMLKPKYNSAPTMKMPIKTKDGLKMAKWGLIAPWAKEFEMTYSTINARQEGLEDSKLYARLLNKNRCLVPMNSFFEWKGSGKEKTPYLIKLKDREIFAVAGLYDHWHNDKQEEFLSYTIITTEPNRLMESIHNRMPVILSKSDEEKWLNGYNHNLLDSYPEKEMEAFPVSTLVNKPSNDSTAVIEPMGI